MWLSPDRSKSLTENRSGRESQVEPSAAKSSSRSGADFLDLIRKDNVANLGNRMYQASQSMMEKKVSEWCQTKEYRRCWSSTLSAFSWLHAEFKRGVTQQTFCDDDEQHDLLPGPMILIRALMIIFTKLSGWKWLYCSIIINCSLGRCCTLAGLRTRFYSSGWSADCFGTTTGLSFWLPNQAVQFMGSCHLELKQIKPLPSGIVVALLNAKMA